MRLLVVALLMAMFILVPACGAEKETEKHSLDTGRYRGFTVAHLDEASLIEAVEKWHVNQVRYMICPVWRKGELGASTLQESWKKLLADLPAGLDRAHKLGISVIVDLHQLPNDHPEVYMGTRDEKSHAWWLDTSNLDTLLDCWRDLARITAERADQAIWLEIYNEPLDWGYVHQQPCYPPEWPRWAQAAIDEIRKIDTVHPIVISTGPGMLCWGFKDFPPLKDPYMDVIYSLHMWQPLDYTHQGVNDQQIVGWLENGPEYIAKELQPAVDFQKKYGVRMHVGEFGAPRWAPDAEKCLREFIDFFEKMGWDWNYHAFREAGIWSMELGEAVDLLDAEGNYVKTGIAKENPELRYRRYGEPMTGELAKPEGLTERGKVLLEYLKRNLEEKKVGEREAESARAGQEILYRGFTVQDLDKQDLVDIRKEWRGNQVRYMMCPFWRAPGWKMSQDEAFDKMLAELSQGLDDAKKLGLMVIIDLHQIPMDTPPRDENGKVVGIWKHTDYRDKMIECWRRIATITAEREEVIWLELCNEPLAWDEFPSYPATLPIWMQDTIDAIREIDTRHPIVVPTGPGMLCWGFTEFPTLRDAYQDVIYTLHLWQPVNYTHQGVHGNRPLGYPGEVNDSGGGYWDKERLEFELLPAIRFQQEHGVQLYVGEFGAPRWAPGADRYLQDAIEVFEKYGWDWSYHAFREAGVWSAELDETIDLLDEDGQYVKSGTMAENLDLFYSAYGSPGHQKPGESVDNARAQVLKRYLKRNDQDGVKRINKVLFVGGQITYKAPDANYNWTRGCGAAASGADKDYVHVLYEKLCEAQEPLADAELEIAGIDDENTMTGYEHLLPCDADLIVIQLGEGFWEELTKESLQEPYEQMIAELRGGRDVLVVCVGLWDGGERDVLIREAAGNQGAVYVPISDISKQSGHRAVSEYFYQHHELNWLPGDRGMEAIAEAIWQEIEHLVVGHGKI